MGRDRLDAERAEYERQHVAAGRVAVVDDDPEPTRVDRVDVQVGEKIACVALPCAGGVADRRHVAERHAAQLLPGVVLLDLLLEARG